MPPQPGKRHFGHLAKFLASRNLKPKDAEVLGTLLTRDLHLRIDELERRIHCLGEAQSGIASGLSGDMTLALTNSDDLSFTAAEVNAAAGTKEFVFSVKLLDKADGGLRILSWLHELAPVITPTETVADGGVGIPTVIGTPRFLDGCCVVRMLLDGGGTYIPTDFVEVQVQMSATDKLLDHSVLPAAGVKKKVVFT